MLSVEELRNKPMIDLSLAEVDRLPDQDRKYVGHYFTIQRNNGALAMRAMNPVGTVYEVVAGAGVDGTGWIVKPVVPHPVELNVSIAIQCERDALRAIVEAA